MTFPKAAVVITVIIVSSASLGFVGTVTADQDLAVTSVEITPSDPLPGETIRLSTTISNLQSSNETVEITDVFVRSQSDGEIVRVEDLGSIAVGSTMTVPLSVSFDSVGEKDLRIHVVAQDSTGFQRIKYPVQVTVRESSDVQLAIEAEEPIAGEESRVNVTVANGGSTPISNVGLVLESNGAVNNPRRVSGSIPSDTDQEYSFIVRFDEAGTGTLDARLSYTHEGGNTRQTSESIDVTVDPAGAGTEGRIQLTGIETTAFGNTITIQGDAANVGTTDAQSVLLSIRETSNVTPVAPSKDYFIGTVEASEFGTFELTAEVGSSVTTVPVLVEWTVDDERRSEVVQLDIGSTNDVSNRGQQGAARPDGPSGGPSTGGPLGAFNLLGVGGLIGILAVIGITGLLYYFWKRK